MVVIDEEDDWNSESGEDDGDCPGSEDEVEEVIHPTSSPDDSDKSILLLPERNEDKENKAARDLKTPKESRQTIFFQKNEKNLFFSTNTGPLAGSGGTLYV